MPSPPDVRLITDEIIAVLEAADLTVGDGDKPASGGWQDVAGQSTFVPYVVVYRLPGGTLDGTLADPFDDGSHLWQTTAVGPTRSAAERTADIARQAILTGSWTISGRKVMQASHDSDGGTVRDDDQQPALFYALDRYRIDTTPTT